MWRNDIVVGDITLCVEDKEGSSLCIWTYICAEREKLYNTYQEMAIWKSTVTLIYRELLALGRKIDIFKPIYRYLLAFGR
jgi:hypothetical protein